MIKKRNINIEKLRIIAMLMIVCSHILGHGGVLEAVTGGVSGTIVKILMVLCQAGVDIFVIISGYFLCQSAFKTKRIIILWLEVVFYSVVIYGLFVGLGLESFSFTNLVKAFFPISFGQYWFMRVYFYMYICSPFINILIRNLNQKSHLLLCVLGVCLMVIPSSIPLIKTFNAEGGNGILWFVMLYFTGAYLRNYPIKMKKSINIIGIVGLLTFSVLANILIGFITTKIGLNGIGADRFNTFDSFPIYGVAILFVCLALRSKGDKPCSDTLRKVIMFLSSSSLAVYLIHDNPSVRNVIWSILKISTYKGIILFAVIFSTLIIIYLSCILIDKITWTQIKKLANKMNFTKIDEKINSYLF